MTRSADVDPSRHVHEPIARALNGLILVATVSFAIFVMITVAAMVTPDGPLHELSHVAMLVVMAMVVVARGVHMWRHRGPTAESAPTDESWDRAAAGNRFDVMLARVLTVAVPLVWLVGNLLILVHRLPMMENAVPVAGLWLPMAAALWIFATFAWLDFCHDRVAAAIDESDRRFRGYWQDIGRS
jgi:hypothetical protein